MDVLVKFLEAKLHSAGLSWIKLQSFQLRPKDKTVSVELLLEDEPAAIAVTATYLVEGDNLRITSLNTSKKWMTELASLALVKTGGTLPLPGGIQGKIIKFIL